MWPKEAFCCSTKVCPLPDPGSLTRGHIHYERRVKQHCPTANTELSCSTTGWTGMPYNQQTALQAQRGAGRIGQSWPSSAAGALASTIWISRNQGTTERTEERLLMRANGHNTYFSIDISRGLICMFLSWQYSCGQGGCGACTVNIRPWHTSPTDPAKLLAVNGCLCPLAAVHEMDVRE